MPSPYYPFMGAIHSTKISGNFGPKLNGSVRSNRKSFEKTGPPFEMDHFSRSDRLEFWLNGSRPMTLTGRGHDTFLCRITCKKARIWTFFWLDRRQYGWFALFQLAKMPPSVSGCWFQSAFFACVMSSEYTREFVVKFLPAQFLEFEECLLK